MYWGIWRRFSYSLRSYCVTHLSYLFWSCAPFTFGVRNFLQVVERDTIEGGKQPLEEETMEFIGSIIRDIGVQNQLTSY
jgi:hypothetical protein